MNAASNISAMLNRSHFTAVLGAVLMVTAGTGCSIRRPSTATGVTLNTPKLPASFVPNFVEVIPALYRGGQPTAAGFRQLGEMGINIVIDLRGSRESEREQVTKLGMQYVPMEWHCPFPRDEVFARFLELVRTNPGKKIFIHCRLGDDRVGMMIAAYRMAYQGWSAAAAKSEMRAYGFTALHHLICPSLGAYASSFPRRLQTSPAFEAFRRATVMSRPDVSSSKR